MTVDDLRTYGPLIPAWWMPPDHGASTQRAEGSVLLDTGASGMMIDESLAQQLKLPICGEQEMDGVHGRGKLRKYVAKLILPVVDGSGAAFAFGVPAECTGAPHMAERHRERGKTVVGVLGRNFLQFCALSIDGLSGEISIDIDQSCLTRKT